MDGESLVVGHDYALGHDGRIIRARFVGKKSEKRRPFYSSLSVSTAFSSRTETQFHFEEVDNPLNRWHDVARDHAEARSVICTWSDYALVQGALRWLGLPDDPEASTWARELRWELRPDELPDIARRLKALGADLGSQD
jgi:hypothetical protein